MTRRHTDDFVLTAGSIKFGRISLISLMAAMGGSLVAASVIMSSGSGSMSTGAITKLRSNAKVAAKLPT